MDYVWILNFSTTYW